MIYEYPEEFIVPVIYVKELIGNSIYRCENIKYLHVGKLLIPNEELEEDKMFLENENTNFFNMEDGALKEHYEKYLTKHSTDGDSLESENMKNIISEIDEDYVNSETSGIYNSKH